MGLDSVELVMEFEKAFEIRIPDQDAEKLRTVGDVHHYIWNHIEHWHTNKCNSQILFYRTRKYCSDQFGLSKNLFKTDSNLNNLIPKEKRRSVYLALEKEIRLKLPPLILTKPWCNLLNAIGLLSIGGSLAMAIILCLFFSYSKLLFILPVAGIIITFFLSYMLNPKRRIISPPLVRDFIQKTLSLNFIEFANNSGTNRKEVEVVINHIISDKLGVDLEEVTPEKSFTDDLGVD